MSVATVIEQGAKEPSRFARAFEATCADHVRACIPALSLESLEEIHAKDQIDSILIHWDACAAPEYVVEFVHQHPALSLVPVAVAFSRISQQQIDYLKEYSVRYLMPLKANLQSDSEAILKFFEEDTQGRKPEAVAQRALRTFFHFVHNDRFDDAEDLIGSTLKGLFPMAELVFFKGLVLKARKRFDESTAYLAEGLETTRRNNMLEPKFLHLIGNVAFKRRDHQRAESFLLAADKLSPANLRRKFILGQLYNELGDQDKALEYYLSIYKNCRHYPGIHARMVEILLPRVKSLKQVDTLARFLDYIPERKLVVLYKKLPKVDDAIRRRWLDHMIRAFSRQGERLIAKKDYFGAIKYYNHALKIIDPSDLKRMGKIQYLFARAHRLAGDLESAREHLRLARQSGAVDEAKLARLEASMRAAS